MKKQHMNTEQALAQVRQLGVFGEKKLVMRKKFGKLLAIVFLFVMTLGVIPQHEIQKAVFASPPQ